MKRLTIFLAGLVIYFTVYAQEVKIQDANAEIREAKNFHAVKLSNAFNVYLTPGNEESVAVSAADKKYMEYIKVEVKNGVLYIGYDGKGKWNTGNKKLKAYISFKQIDKLDAGGACEVDIIGEWKADEANINLSGASDLHGKITARKLSLDLSGASDMKITGRVVELSVQASGASKFQGLDLPADYCNAKASGASEIRITVNKEMSVYTSGASDIDYSGNGVIRDLKTSGASSVSRIGS